MRAIDDLVIVLDSEGRYLKIAPTNNELLFQPAAAMLGKRLRDVLPNTQAEELSCRRSSARSKRSARWKSSTRCRLAVKFCGFIAHISPMSSDRVVWVARDITRRKRAEVALAQAEERYRSIFENAVEGIFQTDAQGRYLSANSALAQIYGYDSPPELMHELTDISNQLYLEEGRREEFTRLLARHDRVSKFESRVRRKDGTVIWISENARAVRNENGTLIYYEGTVEDITERKWQQRQVEDQQTRLQEINLQLQVFGDRRQLDRLAKTIARCKIRCATKANAPKTKPGLFRFCYSMSIASSATTTLSAIPQATTCCDNSRRY